MIGSPHDGTPFRFEMWQTHLEDDIEVTARDRQTNKEQTWPLRRGWEGRVDRWIQQQRDECPTTTSSPTPPPLPTRSDS